MKHHSLSLAILISVIGAASFQILLLVVASWSGIAVTGEVSLCQSIAVLICAIGLSDLKSLSIRILVEDRSLNQLCKLRNTVLVFLGAISIALCAATSHGGVLADLIVIRAVSQAADLNISIWQKSLKPGPIVGFSLARYGLVGVTLAITTFFSSSLLIGLTVAALFATVIFITEQLIISTVVGGRQLTWNLTSIADLRGNSLLGAYTALSLSAGLNFLPQTIIRYFISLFGSMHILGSFSIQYQMSMLSIPFITALSQQALARRSITWGSIVRDLRLISLTSVLLLFFVTLLFVTPASYFVSLLFTTWHPLSIYSTLLITLSSIFLCLTVYLGFMSIALKNPVAQSIANITFLVILVIFGYLMGLLVGVFGILTALLLSTSSRAFILFYIVRKSALKQDGVISDSGYKD